MTNKKKKINNNNANKKSFSKKYSVIGMAVLIAIVGIVISYPYLVSSNAILESSSDKSNILGDWHDIHGVGLFNTDDSSNDNDNSFILLLIMVCITKNKIHHGLKLEVINPI